MADDPATSGARSADRIGSGFESTRYLAKWLPISAAIGIVAGLGAIAFYLAIDLVAEAALGRAVGYEPPSPLGEGAHGITGMARPWLLPLVTALGGLIAGLVVFKLAPEAEGHGTDSAIDAIHHRQGRIRGRIPLVKLVASAITIGTGGSAGREGPAAQISAGFGALLGKWLRLSAGDRRIAVAAGMGAGIGAIFRAPLGGAVLAAEILYLHDLEVEALFPALMASIVGYAVFGSFFGYAPVFGAQPDLALGSPVQLVYYAALGTVCGLVGILYARSFYGVAHLFHRLRLPRWLKPALGGLLVGLMALVLPQVLSMGYGWLQIGMTQQLLSLPLWLVLLLPFAKILATSLTVGSGGSGGVFAPGMFLGGMLGAALWRLGHLLLPAMPASPAPFVMVGMMALFGGIAHAPLAVMLMVAEMTGNLSLLAPAMLAVAVSYAICGDNSIYESQLPDRASAPYHRLRYSFPLLSSLLVRDAMTGPEPVLGADSPLSDAEGWLRSGGPAGIMVVDEDGRVFGAIPRDVALGVPRADRQEIRARDVMSGEVTVLDPGQALDAALERMSEGGASWAAVVEQGRPVGRLNVRDITRTYKDTLQRGVRRASALPEGAAILEARLGESSPLAGRTLGEAELPGGTLVLSVTRNGQVIFPSGSTRLEAGDVVLIATDPARESELSAYLGSPPAGPRGSGHA